VGMAMVASFEGCTECGICAESCPEDAITVGHDEGGRPSIEVRSARCLGLSCLRCELSCPDHVFHFTEFLHAR
jgi:NAD-dependent dihydropyrimidine dehydrogenase PreA subunit